MTTGRTISESMRKGIEQSSWIRQMFEEGNRLKAQFGPDEVFDFSLGNPSVPPPSRFREVLVQVAKESGGNDHRYMTNTGLETTRRFLADQESALHGGPRFDINHIVMTCGAAGGLNILLRSLLDPGDEVILLTPYFPEYVFYIGNFGGVVVEVPSDENFQPDLEAIAAALTPRTRAIIYNSPNNPTGVVYEHERLAGLGKLVEQHAESMGRPVYLISDEPYRKIRYDDGAYSSVINNCRYGVVVTSFSKDLGLAGERIGFVLLNPESPGVEELFSALAIATRTLGFVNAPALMQRVLPLCGDLSVDVEVYRSNRDLIFEGLKAAGYDMIEPQGAFFLFPKVPGGDDVAFTEALRKQRVLVVPGRGFGTPGHIRISYAVPRKVIERALPLFAATLANYQQENQALKSQSRG
ncbi:MAG: pyridoxal phosphate-dependent aminotransferase [Planctomycetota bacterium]